MYIYEKILKSRSKYHTNIHLDSLALQSLNTPGLKKYLDNLLYASSHINHQLFQRSARIA